MNENLNLKTVKYNITIKFESKMPHAGNFNQNQSQ